jgi:hypothetical protein
MDDRPGFPAGVQRAAGLAGPDATVRAIRENARAYLWDRLDGLPARAARPPRSDGCLASNRAIKLVR